MKQKKKRLEKVVEEMEFKKLKQAFYEEYAMKP